MAKRSTKKSCKGKMVSKKSVRSKAKKSKKTMKRKHQKGGEGNNAPKIEPYKGNALPAQNEFKNLMLNHKRARRAANNIAERQRKKTMAEKLFGSKKKITDPDEADLLKKLKQLKKKYPKATIEGTKIIGPLFAIDAKKVYQFAKDKYLNESHTYLDFIIYVKKVKLAHKEVVDSVWEENFGLELYNKILEE